MAERKHVIIYTDGACSGNPGPGGWGSILMYGDNKKELSGGDPNTTNNRMELMAAIEGLRALKMPCDVDLYTDSAYLHNAFAQNWLSGWIKNNWKKSDKKPVINVDLWKELLHLASVHNITWHKVKGHADNEYNNRCDELARAAIDAVREDFPCDEEYAIYIAYEFQNGIGCYNSYVIHGSVCDGFSDKSDSEYHLILSALTKSFAAVRKSSIIGLYVTNGAILDAVEKAKPDSDYKQEVWLYELMQAHDVRLHKQTDSERDERMISCQKAVRETFGTLCRDCAAQNGKLFVKLFYAAEAGEKCGGWYSLLTDGKVMRNLSGKYASVTQNFLRLTAITETLETLEGNPCVEIHTDSSYIYDTATQRLSVWQKNNWSKANQKEASHAELWRRICEFSQVFEIYWFKQEKNDTDERLQKCRQNVSELIV